MKKISIKLKTDQIEKLIGNELISKGYEYECSAKNGYWHFKKYEEEVIKKIDIVDNKQNLTIQLSTNLKFQCIKLNEIVPDAQFEDAGITYDDFNSFVGAAQILKKLLEEYGFAELDRMGTIPEGPRVSVKSSIYIRDHREEIVEKRKRDWELEGKSKEEQLEALSRLIEDEKKKDFKDAEPILADIAAIYGEIVSNHYCGVWNWAKYAYNLVIDIDEGSNSTVDVPLRDVVKQWKGENTIFESFASIRKELDRQKKQREYELTLRSLLKKL